ncbi:MAG: ETEC_3214 domain-containing protein [Mobilitalea sp.]
MKQEKGLIGHLKNFDGKISIKIKNLRKYILIRFITKFFSEVLLAIIISVAIYMSNTFYDEASRLKIENEKLRSLAVGISQNYMNSLFSIPQVDYTSIDGYHVSAYILNDYVILATFDKDLLVSFFLAIVDNERKIDLSTYYGQENIVLGKSTFYDTSNKPNAEVNIPASGTYMYYRETSSYGRPGDFNSYVYAFTPYGTDVGTDASNIINASREYLDDTIGEANNDNLIYKDEYDNARKMVRPNTFGIIMSGYEEKISIIPYDDEWINILGVINQYNNEN